MRFCNGWESQHFWYARFCELCSSNSTVSIPASGIQIRFEGLNDHEDGGLLWERQWRYMKNNSTAHQDYFLNPAPQLGRDDHQMTIISPSLGNWGPFM